MSNSKLESVVRGEQLLDRVRQVLKKEGLSTQDKVELENEVETYLLPALDKFRDAGRFIYEPFLFEKSGIIGKLKNLTLGKIGNVARNVVEKSVMRQQKFNDNSYTLLMHLYNENRELKERVDKLEGKHKDESK